MKRRCVGFVRPHRSKNGWIRCKNHPLTGDRFCSTHRDALDGAFLGLFRRHYVFRDDQDTETQTAGAASENVQRPFDRAIFPRGAFSCIGGRSIAATTTASERPAKKLPSRKRVRIGDALRRKGLDEWTIADGYVDVVGKLTRKSEKNDTVAKLLVDVLKECSRHLEPPRSADAAPDAPVIVKLVHAVSRPVREKQLTADRS